MNNFGKLHEKIKSEKTKKKIKKGNNLKKQ